MAVKPLLFMAFLLAAAAVPPMAEAELETGLFGLIRIGGVLSCAINSTEITSTTPVFPNASVQLHCGNDVVSTATTTNTGVFSFLLDPLTTLLSSVLSNCSLVVGTPLSACNTSLPAIGTLKSPLGLVESTIFQQGLLSVTNIVPTGFNLVQ